ncbi:MAG: hypothetical protein ACI9O4_000848, partial [Chitinophagales bacterium]
KLRILIDGNKLISKIHIMYSCFIEKSGCRLTGDRFSFMMQI